MVHRYQATLSQDDELGRKLANLRVEHRRMLPIAFALFSATLLGIAAAIHDWESLILALIGCGVTVSFIAQSVQERRIIQRGWSAAVGTVLSRRRTGTRYGVEIKYGFRASDDLVYLGAVTRGAWLPKEGATLGIVYGSETPSRSLPLSQFWFYEFSFAAQSHTASGAIPSAVQDRRVP